MRCHRSCVWQGFHVFALDYSVKWPLSIVLSKRALTKYQLLFRHLFFCKHVERELCSAFLTHQVPGSPGTCCVGRRCRLLLWWSHPKC